MKGRVPVSVLSMKPLTAQGTNEGIARISEKKKKEGTREGRQEVKKGKRREERGDRRGQGQWRDFKALVKRSKC